MGEECVSLVRHIVDGFPVSKADHPPLLQKKKKLYPNKWHSTGVVAEVLPNRQYRVVLDGSRRMTLRNRRFLKKILPVSRRIYNDSFDSLADEQVQPTPPDPAQPPSILPEEPVVAIEEPPLPSVETEDQPVVVDTPPPPSPPVVHDGAPLRRSSREKAPRRIFSAKLKGKSHE